MPSKWLRVRYNKQHCLLSDVLPYEVPISFSNKFFYEFVVRNRISVKGKCLIWQKGTAVLDRIIHLLFGLPVNPDRLGDVADFVGSRLVEFRQYKLGSGSRPKPGRFNTPFVYRMKHKENEFRELCIPHPLDQLKVVEFYDRCKELILYYSSVSSFSIRAPAKMTKFVFFRDDLHRKSRTTDVSAIEVVRRESESFKSFFVYWRYSNIYKFFESYRYHRCEKKYNKLTRLDISKCFDSIYTHSIGWAILGKEAQKQSLSESNTTFSGQFDKLMRQMNGGETNGIIIGPEFSRIFAEIILQAVDVDLERTLRNGSNPLRHKIDYEIFRYVDDYFIFYNEESCRKSILDQLQIVLRKYKLYLNFAKEVSYEKPLITELTIAKNKISDLLEGGICFFISPAENGDEKTNPRASIRLHANSLITSFKSIVSECRVAYRDVLNYTFAVIERRCDSEFKDLCSLPADALSESQVVRSLANLIEFVFFVYSVSPRVNTTIRLCLILRTIHQFISLRELSERAVESINKKLFDNLSFILRKEKSEEEVQVETLYLLVELRELGRDYWLEQHVLADYLGLGRTSSRTEKKIRARSLNYFTISVALFYMKEKVRYTELRRDIVAAALDKIRLHAETKEQDAELVYLLFDLLSCPYVPESDKLEALDLFGVTDKSLATGIVRYIEIGGSIRGWFTNWKNFDFGKELYAKRSNEVY